MVVDSFLFCLPSRLILRIKQYPTNIQKLLSYREIQVLERHLRTIHLVLQDVALKGMEDNCTTNWVIQLRDVIYEVDNIIDVGNMELRSRQRLLSRSRSFFGCHFLVEANHELQLAFRIWQINKQLEPILKNRPLLLPQSDRKVPLDDKGPNQTKSSATLVGENIEKDANKMVKLLLQDREAAKYALFAIAGMGGVGKTALAQRIYNDKGVCNVFETRIWVHVSQEFSETDLLRRIIKASGGEYNQATTRPHLEEMLHKFMANMKLLLVLDDVWSGEVWTALLKHPLQSCSRGSRILVTTRNENVARRMGAVHLHKVSLLSDQDSLSLFLKIVFPCDAEEEHKPLLEESNGADANTFNHTIEICGGLPLAIQFVGKIYKKSPGKSSVKDSLENVSAWSAQLKSLLLSYKVLPSHLKMCFLYCSLFPEDRPLTSGDLIQLWIVEGLVESKSGMALEDIAEDYCSELVSRSLLHQVPENIEDQVGFRMHNVLRYLALYLLQDRYYTDHLQLKGTRAGNQYFLSIAGEEPLQGTKLAEHKNLRSLLVFENGFVNDNFLRYCLQRFKLLRALDLRGAQIETVPDSIGDLVHLRYLNLTKTKIRELPGSIKYLRNLEVFSVKACSVLSSLPRGITELGNLRSLDLLDTGVDKVPAGVNQMKHLNNLGGHLFPLEEMKTLPELRSLHMGKLERAYDGYEMEFSLKERNERKLMGQLHLKLLVLKCSQDEKIDAKGPLRIKQVFEELCPPPSIEQLTIEGFYGGQLPQWMFFTTYLRNLTRLSLQRCMSCRVLPPLGDLPKLRYLHMSALTEVKAIDFAFYGKRSFPMLEWLIIEGMTKLVTWNGSKQKDFRCLKVFLLENCPKLSSIPRCLELASLGADHSRQISDLPILENYKVTKCPALKFSAEVCTQ